MKITVRTGMLAIAMLIVGFAVGMGIKIAYESSNFKPYDWLADDPIIINCYGSDFSEPQMMRAIEYWRVRGHNIGFYEHNPPADVCKSADLWGFIIIKKKQNGFDDGTIATTIRRTTGLKIRSATIYYSPGSFNLDLINEHELGHAFGYGHIKIDNHIMHPEYNRMGNEFYFPE
jgi:hypothetical protein